jgi:hypothetical protein
MLFSSLDGRLNVLWSRLILARVRIALVQVGSIPELLIYHARVFSVGSAHLTVHVLVHVGILLSLVTLVFLVASAFRLRGVEEDAVKVCLHFDALFAI